MKYLATQESYLLPEVVSNLNFTLKKKKITGHEKKKMRERKSIKPSEERENLQHPLSTLLIQGTLLSSNKKYFIRSSTLKMRQEYYCLSVYICAVYLVKEISQKDFTGYNRKLAMSLSKQKLFNVFVLLTKTCHFYG